MDGEFEPIQSQLTELGITLNTTSWSEYVPEIEHQIHVIKEQVHACCHTLPFKSITKLMTIEMVKNAVMWINAFPPKEGISTSVSLREIVTGMKLDYNKHCKIQFGSYVQTHEDNEPTNSMDSHTVGAIALSPVNNLQG